MRLAALFQVGYRHNSAERKVYVYNFQALEKEAGDFECFYVIRTF